MLTFRFKTALLIDDNDVDTLIHSKLVKNSCFAEEIIIKYSAIEALEYLSERLFSSQAFPEIIFLDINMPLMNGFDFLTELDKFPVSVWKETKIIMLSSTIHKEEIDKIHSNPKVYTFICKPLTALGLMRLM
jgi:CheY-like chemotaxis protein